MRLFAERGYDATTVSDIAAEAEVAPRTVSLYFPTKLDIAQASATDAIERLIAVLEHPRRSASMAQSVVGWLHEESVHVDAEEWDLRAEMYSANPFLINTATWQGAALGAASAGILAAELGVPGTHVAVRLSGGAIAGVLTHYTLLMRRSDQTAELLGLVQGLVQGIIDGARGALATAN